MLEMQGGLWNTTAFLDAESRLIRGRQIRVCYTKSACPSQRPDAPAISGLMSIQRQP